MGGGPWDNYKGFKKGVHRVRQDLGKLCARLPDLMKSLPGFRRVLGARVRASRLGFGVYGFGVQDFVLNLSRRSSAIGLRLPRLFNLRPETSFCHVLGELCAYVIVLTLVAFICYCLSLTFLF